MLTVSEVSVSDQAVAQQDESNPMDDLARVVLLEKSTDGRKILWFKTSRPLRKELERVLDTRFCRAREDTDPIARDSLWVDLAQLAKKWGFVEILASIRLRWDPAVVRGSGALRGSEESHICPLVPPCMVVAEHNSIVVTTAGPHSHEPLAKHSLCR